MPRSKRLRRVVGTLLLGGALIGTGCSRSNEPSSSPAPEGALEVGDQAPSFALPSTEGQTVDLGDYRDERPVLLYFSMGPG